MLINPVKNIHTTHSRRGCMEYLLTLKPSKEISEKLNQEKEWLNNTLQHCIEIKDKLQIEIAGFTAKEIMENTLIRWIQKICNVQKSFIVTFNNYSMLPPGTIYLRIQDYQPFHHLANQLKMVDGFIQSNDCPAARFMATPFLAIAKDIPEMLNNNTIYTIAARTFHESFSATTLELIKRNHKKDGYELVNTFTLPSNFPFYG